MFLAAVHIRNYRCFADQTVQFRPGVNVLLGENNAGKTTIIRALGLVLDQRARRRPTFFDFHHPPQDWTAPPAITVTLTFRSSETDSVDDLALVATWLTELDPPWEAQLTYTFRLEPDQEAKCMDALAKISVPNFLEYRRVVESQLEKYVTKTYGGAIENQMEAERDSLEKITLHSLDALRDAARELLTGTDPLLKRLLKQVRDEGKSDEQIAESTKELVVLTQALGKHISGRISLDPLLRLVNDTGAVEGGKPQLADDLSEEDLLYALRLYVETNGVRIPAELNGLGYNNLIYIGLVLASLDHQADPARHGTNASIFPILSIEEPEAHLHPALQYKLLKHIEKRVRETKRNRQVFITTHSTHITSASPLDQLIVCTLPNTTGTPCVAYPGKCFADNNDGKASKAYVERYLDATKSNLLFSKGVILVEGSSRKRRRTAHHVRRYQPGARPPLPRHANPHSRTRTASTRTGAYSHAPRKPLGEVKALVRSNVHDTATGKYLLIPQGSRMVGVYDSQITYAQNRLQVIWTRIIYPDGSSINLDGMMGQDIQGMAGFHDQVDNHYKRLIGSALLTSAFAAGIELSQRQNAFLLTTPTAGQTASAAVGQQLGELGSEITRKNLSIQPTIKVPVGYRFNVRVNRDILFDAPYTPAEP